MFSISIQRNDSERNAIDKRLTNLFTVTGDLRAECSITDPVLIIAGDIDSFVDCNYLTIPIFGRSYFVTNIRSIRTGLTEISAHVDVLQSFRDEIKANKAIIERNEIEYDLKLNDGMFKTQQNPRIAQFPFSAGFNTWNFVLAIAGN